MKKITSELLSELQLDETTYSEYVKKNPDSFIEIDLKNFWHELVDKSNLKKSDIINKSDFGYVYFYDVINGTKLPSRDKILKLLLTMNLPLEDCQNALRFCGKSQLYPRIKRDSIIIYGVTHKMSVYQVDELLSAQNEDTLK